MSRYSRICNKIEELFKKDSRMLRMYKKLKENPKIEIAPIDNKHNKYTGSCTVSSLNEKYKVGEKNKFLIKLNYTDISENEDVIASNLFNRILPHELAHAIMITEIKYNPKYDINKDKNSFDCGINCMDLIYHPKVYKIQIDNGIPLEELNSMFPDEYFKSHTDINFEDFYYFVNSALLHLEISQAKDGILKKLPEELQESTKKLFNKIENASTEISSVDKSKKNIDQIDKLLTSIKTEIESNDYKWEC